jgi:hypothetical protein
MLRLLPVAGVILLGAIGIARADVFRWVDDKGVPHYSDQWVPGSTIVKTDKAHPAGSSAARAEQKSLSSESNRISQQLADQDNSRAMQQEKGARQQAQCKSATDSYNKAMEARRITKPGKDGELEFLTDVESDAYRETLRKNVKDLCGSVPVFDPDKPLNPQPTAVPEPKVNPALATSK